MTLPARTSDNRHSPVWTLAVLHPAFALTGVFHSINGPLLPSLVSNFHLNDSQAGALLFAYYAGTSVGAVLCGRKHALTITLGFLALTLVCPVVAIAGQAPLIPMFLLLGICVGIPMTAVSMYAGQAFGARSAAPLTFLNFSWSVGALLAPLLAARLLVNHTYRAAYIILAVAAALATVACWVQLKDVPEKKGTDSPRPGFADLGLIGLFAVLMFLEVGIENVSASWLTTYVLRSAGTGAALAAAATSLYWGGFLASRGLSSLLLLRVDPVRLLRAAILAGLAASIILINLPGTASRVISMVVLGAALAPIFPLLLARFFAVARRSSDSRWVLALCGFGGSFFPWITGSISAHLGSLRLGLLTIPAGLLAVVSMLPLIRIRHAQP